MNYHMINPNPYINDDWCQLWTQPDKWAHLCDGLDTFRSFWRFFSPRQEFCPDEWIEQMAGFLRGHNMQLWLAVSVLKCGSPDGQRSMRLIRETLERLDSFSIIPSRLCMDEPLRASLFQLKHCDPEWAAMTDEQRIEEGAELTAQWMRHMWALYPDMEISLTEPWPRCSGEQINRFIGKLIKRNAEPIAWSADINLGQMNLWHSQWVDLLRVVHANMLLRVQNELLITPGRVTESDQGWRKGTHKFLDEVLTNVPPEHWNTCGVVSWHDFPEMCLPETDLYSFCGIAAAARGWIGEIS